ncbi:MAG: ABC transporter ATP-binding protein [Acidimicrobiia bacterium]|nr:ABC transporter ATP-binding protein [Acidimicrobiia bacterium]
MAGVPISVRDVSMRYSTRGGAVEVLADFDLAVDAGERLAIMGPSGAGKTTLLALIGGLEAIQRGSIVVGGTDLAHLHGDALAAYRYQTVGFVFQHFGLLGNLSARENIELAMSFGGRSSRDRRARAQLLLDAVGIAHRADHRPAELSGGESQRVALARALANEPRLLLADEPTGNLDGETAERVLELLDRTAADSGATLLTVTHDPAVARRFDRIIQLEPRVIAS